MQLEQARSLASALMAQHGLTDWKFGFDGARRRLGACWPGRKRITLSRHFVELNDPSLVRDVTLHEIAHALTPGDGHGERFRRKATELGCNPASCIPSCLVVASPPRYVLVCPHCGRSWDRYRRPSKPLACGACARAHSGSVSSLTVRSTQYARRRGT